jgi:hypothetical protein
MRRHFGAGMLEARRAVQHGIALKILEIADDVPLSAHAPGVKPAGGGR